ncbi:acyl-CoA carboxylase subunit epsilon [Streptomyces pinistramenti]|uniref:acyl-CoA carboxylase subunit epsilon n=1 Tax=Streptomyces pinistramenti TaxID=2884812 RepID=UPI001D08DAE9|nr:acyl-CoA carboxylase subunit epsilon [Streptomyces pinistramenti]MCB5909989.1 acyl-CoA carboxylase subunit epsilon [Streptomyces pinistramenti]
MTGAPAADSAARQELLRVERGSPNEEELAAVTVVLMARAAAVRDTAPDGSPVPGVPGARWRRPERAPAFADPRAWHRDHR